MGRMARGWQLTKQSWAVVRGDRSLAVFPLVSGVAALITVAVFAAAGLGVYNASGAEWTLIPVAVVGVYFLIVIGVFCSVALCACATRALDGEQTTVGEGLSAARGRLGLIFQWAAVQLVVGAIISALEALLKEGAGALIGSIVGGLANVAWAVATYFVVPVLALEGLGPKDALKRSTSVVRARWGEGVTGAGVIGVVFLLAGFLPALVLIGLGVVAAKDDTPLAVALIAIGTVVFIVALLLQATVVSVFKVALYRFAVDGTVAGGFDAEQLQSAFKPKRSRR